MSKIECERGKTMIYPGQYPRLLVTPVFAHEGDFMWIEKIVCMYDSDLDGIEEPEFEFHRDTAHYEKNERLLAENAKLRELVRWMYDRMDESCAVQHAYAPAPISYDLLMQALARARELGIEVG